MLDFDTALDLLNKYGYTSISVHPFIYQDGDTIGICYTYVDEEYGMLERIKIFNDKEEFEEFLQMYNWVQTNGKMHHVRMILDNYESINPKVMFLRNEKIMVEGEMFDIESYDTRESMRVNMDPVSKVIYECGDLLLVYNEIKNRQLQYLKNIIKLKNSLRHKYFDLQAEVDKYNKVKVERNLTLLPEVTESGINEGLEISIKDRYNQYIAARPDYDEAVDFLKDVWDLCLELELNNNYYEAQKEETDIRNEMKIVDQKLTLMRSLNDELKPIFGIDLISRFKKINRVCKNESTAISSEFISQQMDAVRRKYSFYDKIDTLYTSDYLREAIQNSNYNDLAIKYAPGANYEVISRYKTPLNEVAASLSVQYRDKLSPSEQAILVLYNNPKYRLLCNAILSVENFDTVPIKTIMKAIGSIKGFSKVKSECYESVRKRIDDPVNQKLKSSLFAKFDFTTFETFVVSLVNSLAALKSVNEKMILSGDINMYVAVHKVEDLETKKFIMTTNDIQGLISIIKDSKNLIGITLLKAGTPVLYSPYCFDLGDLYTKGASPEMYIKEMINFELLIDNSDITINIDPNKTIVAKYYSVPNVVENLSIVDDIKMSYKTTFCKYALTSKLSSVVQMNQSQAVASNVSPVVSSVFDAGTLASVQSDGPVSNVSEEKVADVSNVSLVPEVNDDKTDEVVEVKTEQPIEVIKTESVDTNAVSEVADDKVEEANKDITLDNGVSKVDSKIEENENKQVAEIINSKPEDKTHDNVNPVTTEVKTNEIEIPKANVLPNNDETLKTVKLDVKNDVEMPVIKEDKKEITPVINDSEKSVIKVEPKEEIPEMAKLIIEANKKAEVGDSNEPKVSVDNPVVKTAEVGKNEDLLVKKVVTPVVNKTVVSNDDNVEVKPVLPVAAISEVKPVIKSTGETSKVVKQVVPNTVPVKKVVTSATPVPKVVAKPSVTSGTMVKPVVNNTSVKTNVAVKPVVSNTQANVQVKPVVKTVTKPVTAVNTVNTVNNATALPKVENKSVQPVIKTEIKKEDN